MEKFLAFVVIALVLFVSPVPCDSTNNINLNFNQMFEGLHLDFPAPAPTPVLAATPTPSSCPTCVNRSVEVQSYLVFNSINVLKSNDTEYTFRANISSWYVLIDDSLLFDYLLDAALAEFPFVGCTAVQVSSPRSASSVSANIVFRDLQKVGRTISITLTPLSLPLSFSPSQEITFLFSCLVDRSMLDYFDRKYGVLYPGSSTPSLTTRNTEMGGFEAMMTSGKVKRDDCPSSCKDRPCCGSQNCDWNNKCKKNSCFSSLSNVMRMTDATADYERVTISELKVGDTVLTYDASSRALVPSKVYALVHDDRHPGFAEVVKLVTRSEEGEVGEVILTPEHLVMVMTNDFDITSIIYKPVGEVKIGDVVVMMKNMTLSWKSSVGIEWVRGRVMNVKRNGDVVRVMNPLTVTGTIVVDGVVMSCHTGDHTVWQSFTLPLRSLYSSSSIVQNLINSESFSEVIHWFDASVSPLLDGWY